MTTETDTAHAAAVASMVETTWAQRPPKTWTPADGCGRCGWPDLRIPEHGRYAVCRNCRTTHMITAVAS